MILMLICIGCVKVYLKTKKMTNISQAQAGFKANSRRNPLWISRLIHAKSSCACRNRLNFRLFRYTLALPAVPEGKNSVTCIVPDSAPGCKPLGKTGGAGTMFAQIDFR